MEENTEKTLLEMSTKLFKATNKKCFKKLRTTNPTMQFNFIVAFGTTTLFKNMIDQLIWKLDQK